MLILMAGSANQAICQVVISVKTLLEEMTNTSSVASWPQPAYTMKQASSYDRRSVGPDKPGWFANGDANQFIRKENHQGHTEYVMMDADGPGAIVRFWLTSLVKAGRLRLYFDHESQPSVEIPAYDLLKGGLNIGPTLLIPHSSYETDGKGGSTMYLPLPYQRHCKITVEFPDSTTSATPHYYQVNYRTYAAGTRVRTFSKADLTAYRSVIDESEAALWHPGVNDKGKQVKGQQTLAGGKEISFNLPKGSAAIRLLTIKVTPSRKEDRATALRNVVLKIVFDGQQTVWCPVGDFSGSGYGGYVLKSWYRDVGEDATMTSRWVMPYERDATLSLVNKSPFDVDVVLTAAVDKWTWNSQSLYFHASYKYGENIRDAKWDYDVNRIAAEDTTAPIEWNFVKIKGQGIYLGNTLAVNNHMHSWYGEGDAKVWVDDDPFPSEFGTGLEDYYNTSWAPVVVYQTPFANAPRADNPSSFGHNTFTRTRNLDGIPFKRSFTYNLEMLSWDGGTIDAATTVYWYGRAGAAEY